VLRSDDADSGVGNHLQKIAAAQFFLTCAFQTFRLYDSFFSVAANYQRKSLSTLAKVAVMQPVSKLLGHRMLGSASRRG
jgi:hypothetical protein